MDSEIRAAFARIDRYFELGQLQHQELRSDVQGLKHDMHGMKQDMHGMKHDMHGLKQDMQGLKEDMQGMKQALHELRQDLSALTAEFRSFRDWATAQFAELRSAIRDLSSRLERVER